jgi:20S proteasome alpha/beta subunit
MVMHRGNLNDFINYLTQQRRNPMIDALRPFVSRLIAPFITALLAWAALHGFDFGSDAAGHITEYAVVILVAGMQIVNGLIHKSIDKKVNPADAASSQIAAVAKAESEKGVT